jgi:hypothetical protein
MLFEEGNNPFAEVIESSNPVSHSLAVIAANHPAAEKLLQAMKQLHIPTMLNNSEFGEHLKLAGHLGMRMDAHVEATFSVDKSDNPLGVELLRMRLNVKSLRVLHCWSLPCGLSPCPPEFDCPLFRTNEYRTAV